MFVSLQTIIKWLVLFPGPHIGFFRSYGGSGEWYVSTLAMELMYIFFKSDVIVTRYFCVMRCFRLSDDVYSTGCEKPPRSQGVRCISKSPQVSLFCMMCQFNFMASVSEVECHRNLLIRFLMGGQALLTIVFINSVCTISSQHIFILFSF